MNISQAAARSGLPAKTIRYYEQIGLVVPQRRANGYRAYGSREVDLLAFIHRARGLGFDIGTCRKLLALYEDGGRASADVKSLAREHLSDIERKMTELRAMADALTHLIENCHGDERPDCPIIAGLAGAEPIGCISKEHDPCDS
ncbi:MAG: Cu(I)-responsive transcriptional regulator [Rhizobiales bacterium]|nr:Cu(I)-responsive transcriptional regulator [Hyphomicrobiales bacterium]